MQRIHVIGAIFGGFACLALAVPLRFDTQVEMRDGSRHIAWDLSDINTEDIKRIHGGASAWKLLLAIASTGFFSAAISFSSSVEADEDAEDRAREAEERAKEEQSQLKKAVQSLEHEHLFQLEQERRQIEARAQLEAHQAYAKNVVVNRQLAELMGIPEHQVRELAAQADSILQQQAKPQQQEAIAVQAKPVEDGPSFAIKKPEEQQPTSDRLEIYLGQSPSGDRISWIPSTQINGFALLLGASGSGKTESIKVICDEIAHYGIPVCLIDFHGDLDIQGFTEIELSFGPDSKGVNPLALDSQDVRSGGVLAQKAIVMSQIKNTISLGHNQEEVLREAIAQSYLAKGIYDDKPETWSNEPPTLTDVLGFIDEAIADNTPIGIKEVDAGKNRQIATAASGLKNALKSVFDHPIFSRPSFDFHALLQKPHRINMSHLKNHSLQFIAADTIIRKLMALTRAAGPIPVKPESDRQRYRVFCVIDEAKIISNNGSNKDDPYACLNLIATEWRKFGFGLVAASQITTHFGDEFKKQVKTALILAPGDSDDERKAIAKDTGVPVDHLIKLRGSGHGFYKDGQTLPTEVQVVPSFER